jgi:hypothetical protein
MVLHNSILANYLSETSEYSLRSNSEILLQPINNQNYKFKKNSRYRAFSKCWWIFLRMLFINIIFELPYVFYIYFISIFEFNT